MSTPEDRAGALAGTRVVELGTGIESSFAARVLGDYGAEVIKVEMPDGDPLRRLGLGPHTSAEQAEVLFDYLNWNKSSVSLPATSTAELTRLVRSADIVIQRHGAWDAAAYGVDLGAERERRPRLVVAAVSDFGSGGPYEGRDASDLVLHAVSGIMQISGTSDRPPLKPGLRQSRYCAGLNLAYVALAARLQAIRTGLGAFADLSTLECLSSELVLNEAHYAFLGAVQGRRPREQDPLAGEPLPVEDGWVSLQTSGLLNVDRLAELFDDERFREERFASSEQRTEHARELLEILGEHLSTRKSAEFFTEAGTKGYLAGFVQTAGDLLNCAHLRARQVFHTVGRPQTGRGRVELPASLAALSRTPMRVRRSAPTIGEHTASVMSALHEEAAPDEAPGPDHGPLTGMRVLDLSTVFAVPYMSALMADLGAEVIKVEAPGRLDQTRTMFGRPYFDNDPGVDWWNRSATFQVVNRGKRSITLDLGQPEGRELLKRLVRDSDVLLDNFTPRVLPKWGLTYDDLVAINPRLVMLSNTGYGSTGPWSSFRAQGTTLEATMGLTEYTGYAGGPPSKFGQSYPDFLACWAGIGAVLAALISRETTDEGQWIDLGMYQLGAAVIPEALIAEQVQGATVSRAGNQDLDALFSGVFESSDADRWIAVSAPDADALRRLAAVAECEPVPAALERAMTSWCHARERDVAVETLISAGVQAGAVNDARDLLTDPQLAARGFYEWVEVDALPQPRPVIGRPFRWQSNGAGSWQPQIRAGGPRYAEGNAELLGRGLGLTADQLASLDRQGVIASRPAQHAHPHGPMDLAALLESRELVQLDPDYAADLARLWKRQSRRTAHDPVPQGTTDERC